MFIVAPSGSTKERTSGETPILRELSKVKGSVAAELAVVKANIIAGAANLKNLIGLNLPRIFTESEYTTAACKAQAKYTESTSINSGPSTAAPWDATTGIISANTAYGASFIIPPIIEYITSAKPSMPCLKISAFAPTIEIPTPTNSAKAITWSILPCVSALNGLVGIILRSVSTIPTGAGAS
ncbi:MAG: hypothetical protein BWY62_01432 [Firmicutes bacterium ADurb.Bin356]|nr:MAG: hypothetical protein BWY62_01432 [Firmicutes bacterium ADurb.Bin356]